MQKRTGEIMFDGEWIIEEATLGGQPMPVETFGGAALTMRDGTYEFAGDKGTFTVEDGDPARITIKGTEGPNAGKMIPAICELSGGHLSVCYDLSGAGHPAEFSSPAGTMIFNVKYRRA